MEQETLLTAKQAARAERNKAICKAFSEVRAKYPDSSTERIAEEVSKTYHLTNCSIRAIVKKQGLC